jgi:ribonuclease HI
VEGLAPWQRNLEPWQRDLVSHTSATKTHRDTAFELSWACRLPEPPRSSSVWPVLVCNGSVQREQGRFGWVLALSTGVVLSTGKGPAYGHDITSYRAEAYGMLSGILYVNKILQFYQSRQDALTSSAKIRNMRIVCDNEGLITAIRTLLHRKRSDFVLNDTIGPEWDVIQAIVQSIREFGTVAMIHVKGHQDEGNANRRLPLLVRLNVQADKLATSFQRLTNHRGDAVPCIGGNYAQLHATPPHIKVP